MKVGERWDCFKCGKPLKEKCSAMDVIGFYVVNGLCPDCAKKDKEVKALLDGIAKGGLLSLKLEAGGKPK